uniref:(northern house mosquito) hypothetical protein n=1 Tax=Culex pipiens TaxID=7175 RepID=A0A8D8L8T9_CULPI
MERIVADRVIAIGAAIRRTLEINGTSTEGTIGTVENEEVIAEVIEVAIAEVIVTAPGTIRRFRRTSKRIYRRGSRSVSWSEILPETVCREVNRRVLATVVAIRTTVAALPATMVHRLSSSRVTARAFRLRSSTIRGSSTPSRTTARVNRRVSSSAGEWIVAIGTIVTAVTWSRGRS